VTSADRSSAAAAAGWRDALGAAVYAAAEAIVVNTASGPIRCFRAQESTRVQDPGPAVPRRSRPVLTARERQCLALVARGLSGTQIADELGIAPNTVAQHLVAVRRKFRVSSTAAAVVRAYGSRDL
jgi:DNA-binding CsgD family transcriptional regulator